MLRSVKMACRISTDVFDEELESLIEEAKKDLSAIGICNSNDENDPLIKKAIKTYCKLNFGEPDNYDKLKESYDEIKAQLQMTDKYTNWGGENG